MTSASSIAKPWLSAAVRQGASPTAQSTSTTTPQVRHTRWWWFVASAQLVTGAGSGGLDASHDAGLGEGVETVVDRLAGHRRQHGADPLVDPTTVGMRKFFDRDQHLGPRPRDPQPGPTQRVLEARVASKSRAAVERRRRLRRRGHGCHPFGYFGLSQVFLTSGAAQAGALSRLTWHSTSLSDTHNATFRQLNAKWRLTDAARDGPPSAISTGGSIRRVDDAAHSSTRAPPTVGRRGSRPPKR